MAQQRTTSVFTLLAAIFFGAVFLIMGAGAFLSQFSYSSGIPEEIERLPPAERNAALVKWQEENALAEKVRAEAAANAKRRQNACYAARVAVERQLKAPATAKFANCQTGEVSVNLHAKDGLIHVNGYVDSQNGFGAMLRSNYRVRMTEFDGQFLLKDVKIR